MIEVSNISFSYDSYKVLSNIDFQLKPGETTCLLGRSGIGKTTLLNILVGLSEPSFGVVRAPFTRPSSSVAYLNQNAGLLPWRTAEENINLSGELLNIALDPDQIKALIDILGLRSHLRKYPDQLSGGELQRFALIQRLILSPNLLVLDEPFGALDIILRRELSLLIGEIVKTRQIYSLVVTHQPEDALFLASEILILSREFPESGAVISKRMKREVDFNESSSYLMFVEAMA